MKGQCCSLFHLCIISCNKQTIGWRCIIMTDEDFDFLEKVFNKLRSARNTKSSVRLNRAEIKIILKNQEDFMAMMADMFDDEDNSGLLN